MPIVVDASIVLAGFFGEPVPRGTPTPAELEQEAWVVPALWWFEIRNGLIVNERRGRNSPELSAGFLAVLSQIATTVDLAPDSDRLMTLSRRHRLTVYDAGYLELATRAGLPLATLDQALARGARAERVPLLGSGAA